MKLRTLLLAATMLGGLGLSHAADAAIANQGSAADVISTYTAATVNTGSYTVNSASNFLAIEVLGSQEPAANNITGVKFNGVAATLAGTATPAGGQGGDWNQLYYLMNPSVGTHTLEVDAVAGAQLRVQVADYSGVGGFVQAVNLPAAAYGTGSLAKTMTIQNANAWVVTGATGTTVTAGSGMTLRQRGAVNNNGILDSNAALAVGAFTVNTTTGGSTSTPSLVAMEIKPSASGPTPTAASCSPASVSLPDTSLSGTQVCAISVTMSDGSTYTGNNTGFAAPFTGPATGTGNITLSRNLASTDDGTFHVTPTFTQNSGSVGLDVPVTVTPPAVAGTPIAFTWATGVDPGGAGAGRVLFTAPKAMTVTEMTLRMKTPAGSTALFDVYKAPSSTACASGTKLHAGDFNANGTANAVVSIAPSVTSLAVNDSVCLVSQSGFPLTSEGTFTFTAN